jgi:DNA polymerase-3 subunit epsilon
VRTAFGSDPGPLVERLLRRIRVLAGSERFEDAAVHRDRLATLVRILVRSQRMAALAAVPHLVAARRLEAGGWELHVVRHGRLAGAGTSPAGADPRPFVDAIVATAETVAPAPPPLPAATAEETECILRWLETPGTRLVDVQGTWALPARGAGAHSAMLSAVELDHAAARPFTDRRPLRPVG